MIRRSQTSVCFIVIRCDLMQYNGKLTIRNIESVACIFIHKLKKTRSQFQVFFCLYI